MIFGHATHFRRKNKRQPCRSLSSLNIHLFTHQKPNQIPYVQPNLRRFGQFHIIFDKFSPFRSKLAPFSASSHCFLPAETAQKHLNQIICQTAVWRNIVPRYLEELSQPFCPCPTFQQDELPPQHLFRCLFRT